MLGQVCFEKKSKERATSEAAAVLESPPGLEDRSLDKKIKSSGLPSVAVPVDICHLYPVNQPSIWKHEGQRRWMQWNRPLDNGQILGVMSNEGRGLYRGCYWGEYTKHGVLDVDTGSQYHSKEALTNLAEDFNLLGLPLVPFQSSESGGWHLYFSFDSFVLSKEVESKIKEYLRFRSYEIKQGTLEIFPSNNALRLPLQKGFAWLTPDGQVKTKREDLTQEQAITRFLRDLDANKTNWEEVKTQIAQEIYSAGAGVAGNAQGEEEALIDEGFTGLFKPGLDWEKYQRGRQYWLFGLTENKQRHDAVICLGHYLWYGDEAHGVRALPGRRNREQRARLIEESLERGHNGRSEDINKGRWSEVQSDIYRAASWTRETPLVTKEYEPYQLTERLLKRLEWLHKTTGKLWTIEELEKANISRSIEARQRIALAVAQLEAEGLAVNQLRVAIRAKACRKTVRKNQDLLEGWGGELIAGGLGGPVTPPDFYAGFSQQFRLLDPVPCSGGSIASFSGLRSVSVLSPSEGESLTPCAEAAPGRRRTTDGRGITEDSPPPPARIKAQGLSSGFRGSRYVCGISSVALLLPVFLSGLIFLGFWSARIRQYDRGCVVSSLSIGLISAPIKQDTRLILRLWEIAATRGPPGSF